MNELRKRLEAIAWKRSKPWCYQCYEECPTGTCPRCGSDDLLRMMPGVGCEAGISWVADQLVRDHLKPVDTSEEFTNWIEDVHPVTTQIGWMELNTVAVLRTMDPVWWDMACQEWLDSEVTDERLFSLTDGAPYYRISDLEEYLESEESELAQQAG